MFRAFCSAFVLLSLLAPLSVVQARPVIFDTDMAIDDWLALLYLAQHPQAELKAVTISASGEAHCAPSKVNVANLLALTNSREQTVIACGDDVPLDGYFTFPKAWRDDADTLSGIELHKAPAGRFPVSNQHAADVIHSVINESSEATDIVAVGPLTNIAQWLQRYPQDKTKAGRLFIMGGNWQVKGNIIVPLFTKDHPNTNAEWNIFIDPLAADQVLQSGLDIVMVGLDVTNQVRVTHAYADQFKTRVKTPAAAFTDQVLDKNRWFIDSNEYYYWDVLTAIIAMDNSLCTPQQQAFAVDHRIAGKEPYLKTSDLSMPDKRWDGQPRSHLDAGYAGHLIAKNEGPTVSYCMKTSAEKAFESFTSVINLP
ncbi:nucleoside hydrolase [Thalassolituus sp. LLYu03]|uniref:nucleoside hydrolase n=1 Tax=Thalassolituus sp. LLYu03 TaxID=3421656 RepID=UPI003D2E055B